MTTTATQVAGTITGPVSGATPVALGTADFMAATHLEVVQETSAGVVTVLSAGVDYTVALDGTAPNTATLTTISSIASGDFWHWRRVTTLDQQLDLTALGTFPADSVERAFDSAVLATQEGRSVDKSMLRSFAYSNNWADANGARYYKHDGIVHLEGAISSSPGPAALETMLTLPVGYRPAVSLIVAGIYTSPSMGANQPYTISINTSGVMQWTLANHNAVSLLYLDGISFRPA